MKSEYVLNQINNQVHTLPLGSFGGSRPGGGVGPSVTQETTYDLKGGRQPVQRIPETKIGSEIKQVTGPTPGQSVRKICV